MIYSDEPMDWRDLQNKVCEILRVCGCDAEVEKTIETVRGKVDVDVHAIDPVMRPKLTYLCECKYWSAAVPKNVVHGFRTVVADYGAHMGFIISKSGFQHGAYEAATNSNIRLVNWWEFQRLFLDRWKEGRYARLRQLFEDLFDFYTFLDDPIQSIIHGGQKPKDEYVALIKRYSPQAAANPWDRMLHPEKFPPPLPYYAIEIASDGKEREIIFKDYASLFDWHESRAQTGLKEFHNFVQRYRTGPVDT